MTTRLTIAARVFVLAAWLTVSGACVDSARAQDQAESVDKTSTVEAIQAVANKDQLVKSTKVSAREAVRLGNKQLIEGDAEGALQYYDEAQQLEPNAPQIAYVKGLGYFAAENYDEARQAFEQAAASENEQLAGDAIYGAGITYHAQALALLDDPKAAIGNLESALERYRTVLAHEPGHRAAKDAEVKAAMLRRQLVEQVKQQESKSCDNPQESDEKQKDKEQEKKDSQSDKQDDKEKQEKQDKQDQQQDSDQQDEQKEQQSSQDEKSENEDSKQSEQSESKEGDEKEQEDSSKQAENSDEAKQQKQAQQAKENAEDDKKEQAQRRLREMMDAMRNRKKRRPAQPLPIPVKPVDKDW